MQCAVALRLRIPNGCPLQSCSAPPSTTSQQQPAKTLQYLRPTLFSPHTNHIFSSLSIFFFLTISFPLVLPPLLLPHMFSFSDDIFSFSDCVLTLSYYFLMFPIFPSSPFFSLEVLVEIIEGLVFSATNKFKISAVLTFYWAYPNLQ